MRRFLRNLRRTAVLFFAITFGEYVNSVGGPDQFDDGHIYRFRGRVFKICDPVTIDE